MRCLDLIAFNEEHDHAMLPDDLDQKPILLVIFLARNFVDLQIQIFLFSTLISVTYQRKLDRIASVKNAIRIGFSLGHPAALVQVSDFCCSRIHNKNHGA